MWKVSVLFLILFSYQVQCQFLSDYDTGSSPDDYLRHYWNWRSNSGPGEVWPPRPERRDVEETTQREREPLGPDYHDPEPLPGAEDSTVVDTGVIDVDSSGIPSGFPNGFPEIPDNSGFPTYGASFPGIFNIFGSFRSQKPWWNGPNVCVEREETTEDEDKDELAKNVTKRKSTIEEDDDAESFLTTINLSSCHETPEKYECVTKTSNRGVMKSFTVKYKCCYGYRRLKNASGCSKVELKNIIDTIKELDAVDFNSMITNAGLANKIRAENFTIFVPQDKALSDLADKMVEMNQVEAVRRKRDLHQALSSKDLVLNHMIPGFIDLNEIENEQAFKTELKNSSIRMNIYPTSSGERLITANCIPVRKANVLTENGIVHVIDGVIPPSVKSIKTLIEDSKHLKMLHKVLNHPNLTSVLNRAGPFTFLAPTDAAFEKLDKETRDKLTNGDDCAINILKYHIIPHSVCSSAINGNVTTHNIEGKMFNLERLEDDSFVIDDNVKITTPDVIASNGVIHLVDTLVLPDSGLRIMQFARKHGFKKFEQLVNKVDGLDNVLNNMHNTTFILPKNEAFTPEIEKIIEDASKSSDAKVLLTSMIKYHTISKKLPSCDMNNNEMIKTSNGQDVRVNLYSTLPIFTNVVNRATINCARLVDFDKKSCGSVVHTVDKVLLPPVDNIYDIVTKSKRFSIISKILKGTDVEPILKNASATITFLAPPDSYLDDISDTDMNILMMDKQKASDVLKNHILTEVMCCSGVGSTPWNFNSYVDTLAKQQKEISRNSRHQIRIGKSTVTKCDILATNGIIHEVNKVMYPVKRSFSFPDLGLFLFDL